MFVSTSIIQPWLRRYLLAEGAGLTSAMVSITLVNRLTDNRLLLMAASLYSGTVAYYSVLILHRLLAEQSLPLLANAGQRRIRMVSTMHTVLLEVGSAELLDSLLISPILLYGTLHLVPNQQLAVVLSEVLSTLAFYATVAGVQYMRKAEMNKVNCYALLFNKQRKPHNEKVFILSDLRAVVDLGVTLVCTSLCGQATNRTVVQRAAGAKSQ